jgi:aquaporin related protein
MPRIPVHREPKTSPHRQNGSQSNHRHSRDYDHQENGRSNHDRSNNQRPPKHQLSTLTTHLIAAVGEFVGTFMFLYFSFAGQLMIVEQASDVARGNGLASSQQNIFTALLYGFSLLVNVWAFYRISGGLFNPAVRTPYPSDLLISFESCSVRRLIASKVTLGMVVSGTLPAIRGLFLFPAQLIAAMCAAALVSAMFPGDINAVQTTLSPETSVAQGVFIEMFMTAELVFVVLMLAAEKSKDTFIAPVGIGLALFVAMMGGTSSSPPTHRRIERVLNNGRCLLHRRFAQSGPKFRPRSRRDEIQPLSLDILDRTLSRCSSRCRVLSFRQVL